MTPARLIVVGWVVALGVAACGDRVETRVLHRSSCTVCHQPLNSEGVPDGIEEAHPFFEVSCTDCHGGNAFLCDGPLDLTGSEPRCDGNWVYDQDLAHVPRADSPADLKSLTADQLDSVDRDYLRFINPGDLRVVSETCGRCHTTQTAAVRRSAHALTAGELAVARFRAGAQPNPLARFGADAVIDPNPSAARFGCGARSVALFDPPPIVPGATDPLNLASVGNAHEHYLVKECLGCHIQDFGPNDAPGNYRSSGCSACHMNYAEDGKSRSRDPWIDKQTPPHPITHELKTAVPTRTCATCHYEGARIGLSYQGMRDPGGPGTEPPNTGTLSRPLHGHPANHYVVDEDTTNAVDETPPDVHFEAGMDCVDCHTRADTHGDGHLYADASCAVRTSCEDCHGTVDTAARPTRGRDNLFDNDAGALTLRVAATGRELVVPQVKGKGFHTLPSGYSHTEDLDCVACHASWVPNCYGCHVDVDLSQSAPYLTNGIPTPGLPTERSGPVTTSDLVLMMGTRGKYGPSVAAQRVFMTLRDFDPGAPPLVDNAPRLQSTAGGVARIGWGQRVVDPHTTQRITPFQKCDRCHTAGELADPSNAVLLDLTHGFGTDRFNVEACDVDQDPTCPPGAPTTTYRLDAIQTRDGTPTVLVGHDLPQASRPLTLDEIARMRAITVPDGATATDIPPDAVTNPRWP